MRKRTIYFLSLLAILAITSISITSCEELSDNINEKIPGIDAVAVESTDNYTVSYKYKDSVIVLTEERLAYLERVEADTILYFSKFTPSSFLPDVGDFVTARSTIKTPYGLGNVVLERTRVGQTYRCVTTSTALDNIFEELDFTYQSSSIIPDTLTHVMDEDGNLHEIEYVDFIDDDPDDESSQRSSIPHTKRAKYYNEKLISWNLEKKFNENTKVVGKVVFGVGLTAEFSLTKRQCEFSFEPIIKGDIEFKANKTLKINWTYPGIKDLHCNLLEIGPITYKPIIDLNFLGEASFEGPIRFKYDPKLDFIIGFNQDGSLYENKSKILPKSLFDMLEIDAKGTLKPVIVKPSINVSEFTRTHGDEVSLSAGLELETDCKLTDENLFRNNPELEINLYGEQKTKVDFNVKIWKLKFGILNIDYKNKLSVPLAKIPLLPELIKNSLSVNPNEGSEPLSFDAQYTLSGGLLSSFFDLKPGIRVYQGNQLISTLFSAEKVNFLSERNFKYRLSNLKNDVVYTAKPCIMLDNVIYDEDGKSFSAMTPTAAITDIVYIGSDKGSFLGPNGRYYSYKYYHYVNADLVGADLCSEWGIYAPDEIMGDHYKPFPDKNEGIHTQYWTLYANSSTSTTSYTPYVKHLDGHYQLFETNRATFSYYGSSSNSPREVKQQAPRIRRQNIYRMIEVPDGVLVLEYVD